MLRDSRVSDQSSLDLHSGDYVERYKKKPIARVRNLVPRMGLTRGTRIADFGCGNGMLLHAIGDDFASYDGVDFSPDFIAAANEWAERDHRQRYRFHCCDIREFCARNQQAFDVAATLDFSEHVDDALAIEIYAAIRKALCPGGRLYLHTPNLDFFMERARRIGIVPPFPEHVAVRDGPQTLALLVRAGFSPGSITMQTIPHYNVLRWIHPLSRLPIIGRFFAARLWVEAMV
jgi:2-polyprenyl-6-hydroxyphenyl methylase/3-demethylubiquinone-9 3-methyltransferase